MLKKGLYRHYKGNEYEVIDVARHSENEAWHVIYRALYGDRGLWIRPLEMFEENVFVDNQERKRFEYIGEISCHVVRS